MIKTMMCRSAPTSPDNAINFIPFNCYFYCKIKLSLKHYFTAAVQRNKEKESRASKHRYFKNNTCPFNQFDALY